jgi:hypothetical protein
MVRESYRLPDWWGGAILAPTVWRERVAAVLYGYGAFSSGVQVSPSKRWPCLVGPAGLAGLATVIIKQGGGAFLALDFRQARAALAHCGNQCPRFAGVATLFQRSGKKRGLRVLKMGASEDHRRFRRTRKPSCCFQCSLFFSAPGRFQAALGTRGKYTSILIVQEKSFNRVAAAVNRGKVNTVPRSVRAAMRNSIVIHFAAQGETGGNACLRSVSPALRPSPPARPFLCDGWSTP